MALRISSSIALTMLLATFGCTQLAPPLTPPEAGGPTWRELTSEHILLSTDRDEGDAREAITQLEQMVASLRDIAFPQVSIDGRRIHAIHFEREGTYNSFERAGTAGIFTWKLPNDLEPEPTLVVWGSLDADRRATLQHELTHMFVRSTAAGLPPWMSEGLAQYYESFTVEDGYAYIGRPMLKARAWPQTEFRAERNGVFVTALVPIGYVPAVSDLVEMDPAAFYVWTDTGRSPSLEERRKAVSNYLGAYGLVHLIQHDPTYQPKFDSMVEHIAGGMSPRDAWAEAFGFADAEELELAYRKHLLNKYETMVLRTEYTHKPVQIEHREMDPVEVHVLWARLRPLGENQEATRADFAALQADAGTSAEVLFWRGVFYFRTGDFETAVRDITEALELRPNEPRYVHGVAIVRRVQAASGGAGPESEGGVETAMAELTKVATSAAQLNTVADYHERKGQWDEALTFALRAVKVDPTCFVCYSTLGEIFFAKEKYGDAVRAQTIAQSLLPDGVVDPKVQKTLNKYIKAQRSPPSKD